MRIYDCFDIPDQQDQLPGKPFPAIDLRSGQPVRLYRWRAADAGKTAASSPGGRISLEDKAREISSEAGFEAFTAVDSTWLVEPAEGAAAPVLAKLRAAGLFTASEVAPPPPPPPEAAKREAVVPSEPKQAVRPPLKAATMAVLALFVFAILAAIGFTLYRTLAPASPPTATLTADRASIDKGECSRLSWSFSGAQSASISPTVGALSGDGDLRVCPDRTTRYTLTALGSGGKVVRDVVVEVSRARPLPIFGKGDRSADPGKPSPIPAPPVVSNLPPAPATPPVVTLKVSPPVIPRCGSASLDWTATGKFDRIRIGRVDYEMTDLATITPGTAAGSLPIRPVNDSQYKAFVDWSGGASFSVAAGVRVLPAAAPGPPVCGEIAWLGIVPDDGRIVLDWSKGSPPMLQPPPPASVLGAIPHFRVRITPEQSYVRVVSQPFDSGVPRIVLFCSKTGSNSLRLRWDLVR
jgi:hypothetical protein